MNDRSSLDRLSDAKDYALEAQKITRNLDEKAFAEIVAISSRFSSAWWLLAKRWVRFLKTFGFSHPTYLGPRSTGYEIGLCTAIS